MCSAMPTIMITLPMAATAKPMSPIGIPPISSPHTSSNAAASSAPSSLVSEMNLMIIQR